jgi:aspartyl-tRNA(Asn)/glutamyl-tRNA(Gln) amidotransferase subunit A
MDLKNLTIKSLRDGYAKKEFTPEEIRKEFLKLIEKENPKLNVFLSVSENLTHDSKFMIHDSILTGVPCAIKDNIMIKDSITTAGSKILKHYKAPYDATVIKLLKKHGAIFLGKTNMDEFAMGSTTENSAFGPTRNPHDHDRVTGGSSGGSAAAVASGMAVFALGSDTGGSIRAPASWCGVVGLKPTYGRVSRYGLIAMASSFDQIGPITKNVEDAAIVMNSIAGHDPMDSTSSPPHSKFECGGEPKDTPDFTKNLGKPIKGMKIAIAKEFFGSPPHSATECGGKGLNSEVADVIEKAISKLQSQGAHIDYASLPLTDYSIATYYIIVPAEISANLARFDGIRYGHSSVKGKNLLDTYLDSREEGFGAEVKRRIMLGTYTLSAGYYDAYYLKAQKVRTLIRQSFDKIFEHYDAIIGPTMPTIAPKIGEYNDPLTFYMADIYTCQANLAGLPAISVPCGFVETGGKKLPVGLQIIGKHFDEETILRIANAYSNS